MGTTLDNLYDHEGYAARKLPDGTFTSRVLDPSEFTAHVAACDCGRNGEWHGSTEYPPTEAGEDAAIEEWEREHARPLLAMKAPEGLADDVTAFLDRLWTLAVERPVGVLSELRRIERRTDELLGEAVGRARDGGASWSEIGAELRMTKQSAQQRFTSR